MPVYKAYNINNARYSKGFTLVELLITISLIAILSGVLFSVINAKGIQQRARDSQRVSDLAYLKVALENYFADNRQYPVSNWAAVNTALAVLSPNYINTLPADPKVSGTACSGSTWRNYVYKSLDGTRYVIATNMETVSMQNITCPYSGFCSGCTFTGGYTYYAPID